MSYLDKDGVRKLWAKVKALFNKGVTDISINGKTVTITKGDGSTSTQTTKDTEYSVFGGATNSADGSNGLVPAPKSGKQDSFLKGDGTWGTPENTKYNVVSKTAAGLAPQLPNETSTTKYLRQDGTWAVPPDNDTTYSVFKGATASNKGESGLVPAPQMGANKGLLFGNGVWSTIYLDAYDLENGCEIALDANNSDIEHISSVIVPLANANRHGLISRTLFNKIDGLPTATEISNTYAKKSDITNMYVYKGSVADASKLPTTGQQVGWVYNIETASVYGGAGMNVAWNGTAWNPLGEIFTITAITNEELDEICV